MQNKDEELFTFGALVEAMTNNDRHLWARAGYPGLRRKDAEKLLMCPSAQRAKHRLKRRAQSS